MTEPDYDDLLWGLAARLSSKMTLHEIKEWLIKTGKYARLDTMSGDELAAEIETWYVELDRICGVKAV